MGTVALLACVALATVFAVSGLAKLLDRDGTREAVAGFGVPHRLVPPVARALPPVELVVALLLLVPATAVIGLQLTLGLLVAFTAAVVSALRAGRRPECHCFGRIGGADVSWRTVTRNGVLAGLAVVGLIAGAARSGDHLTGAAASLGVVGGLVVAGCVLLVEGLAGRAARRARDRADEEAYERGMAADAHRPAFAFRAATLHGPERSLTDLLAADEPLLLVFLSPGCGPCKALRPAVTRWAEAYQGRLSVGVVAGGGRAANTAIYDGMSGLTVLLDDEEEQLRHGFGVDGMPAAVLVEPDGRIRGGVASGERLVRRLLAAALTGTGMDARHRHDRAGGVPAASLDLSSVPRPRPTVTAHPSGGETVLVDEAEGTSLSLDQIGGIVWSVLDGTSALDAVVTDLAAVFGAPEAVVGPDVLELVRSLGRAGMLEGVAAEPQPHGLETVEGRAAPAR